MDVGQDRKDAIGAQEVKQGKRSGSSSGASQS
jgi:hypothetical protein